MDVKPARMVNLNVTNYYRWSDKMEDLLYMKRLHLLVFASEAPKDKSKEEWEFENTQVCSYVGQYLDDNVYNYIIGIKNAKQLWAKIESLYVKNPRINK